MKPINLDCKCTRRHITPLTLQFNSCSAAKQTPIQPLHCYVSCRCCCLVHHIHQCLRCVSTRGSSTCTEHLRLLLVASQSRSMGYTQTDTERITRGCWYETGLKGPILTWYPFNSRRLQTSCSLQTTSTTRQKTSKSKPCSPGRQERQTPV